MATPARLREDIDGPRLRVLAKRTRDAGQLWRLLALAEIYDGRSRGAAARIGGVTADMPTENGTVLHRGRTPGEDASLVSRSRAADPDEPISCP